MSLTAELEERGLALRPGGVSEESRAFLAKLMPEGIGGAGVRNVLWDRPELRAALAATGLDALASEALGRPAVAINVTAFDKTPEANWKVPGHQDLMMPVESRHDEPGFEGWSMKAGILYVEPPVEVLGKLVALRVHLDDCPATNGALAVVPGSHRRGKLRDAELTALAPDSFVICAAAAGDVLFMKPLLVHRSSAAETPNRRRVLHVVYAADDPGKKLRWRTSLIPERARLPTPPVEVFEEPEVPSAPRRPFPEWLSILGALATIVLGSLFLVAMIANLWQQAKSPQGGQLYRTQWGYKSSPIAVLVTLAVLLVAVVAGGIVAWWHARRSRRSLGRLAGKRATTAHRRR
jgi:hypothetical protein